MLIHQSSLKIPRCKSMSEMTSQQKVLECQLLIGTREHLMIYRGQGFLASYELAPPPSPTASPSVRSNGDRREGQGIGEGPNHMTARKSCPLKIIQYSLIYMNQVLSQLSQAGVSDIGKDQEVMTNEKVFLLLFTEGSANVFSIIFIYFLCVCKKDQEYIQYIVKHRERKIERKSAQSYIISILLMGETHRWNIATRSISGMVWIHFPSIRGGGIFSSFNQNIISHACQQRGVIISPRWVVNSQTIPLTQRGRHSADVCFPYKQSLRCQRLRGDELST